HVTEHARAFTHLPGYAQAQEQGIALQFRAVGLEAAGSRCGGKMCPDGRVDIAEVVRPYELRLDAQIAKVVNRFCADQGTDRSRALCVDLQVGCACTLLVLVLSPPTVRSPDRLCIPAPVFTRPPSPSILPEKPGKPVVFRVRSPATRSISPEPLSPPTVLEPGISKRG